MLKTISLLKDLPLQLLVVGNDEPGLYRALIDQRVLQHRIRFEGPSLEVLPILWTEI